MRLNNRFRDYSWKTLQKDTLAGVIVGVVAIPLAMAFSIASGVKPEYGIYTTIIAGFLVALLGGSRFLIAGPTGAFVPLLLGIVMQYGYEQLLIAGFLAGIILVLMGFLRLGTVIQFIPRPVTIGFTTGIAVVIFTGQINHFLGIKLLKQEDTLLLKLKAITDQIHTLDFPSLLTASLCLAVIILCQKFWPKLPGALLGLIFSSSIAFFFFKDKVNTIGNMFGGFPQSFPSFKGLTFTWDQLTILLVPALLIALLGGIESLLSAHVADSMSGDKHHSNRELVGQGIANMVTPLFGGIPATGAIARTATNIRSGAVTPVSGIIHSIFVLLILLFFAPLAVHIPLASMAPILMVVAWNMSERKQFQQLIQIKTGDSFVLCVTFFLTVFTDLTIAVLTGIGLSVLMFVWRVGQCRIYLEDTHQIDEIGVYRLEGPIFFGSVKKLLDSIHTHPEYKVVILKMEQVPYLDATGEDILAKMFAEFHQQGISLWFTGLRHQPKEIIQRSGLIQKRGKAYFISHFDEALQQAKQQVLEQQRLLLENE